MFRKRQTSVRPIARNEELSATVSGDETLVYDRENFIIHRLNGDAAAVMSLADGSNELSVIAAKLNPSEKDVEETLLGLASSGLVHVESLGKSAVTRRRLIGSAAGAAAAVAFIAPAAASEGLGIVCSPPGKFGGVCRQQPYVANWMCDFDHYDPTTGQNVYTWHCY